MRMPSSDTYRDLPLWRQLTGRFIARSTILPFNYLRPLRLQCAGGANRQAPSGPIFRIANWHNGRREY